MTTKIHKWLVFLSACYVMLVPVGFFYSLGALFVQFMDVFQTSRAEAALIQSVGAAVSLISGCIHGPLMQRFGMVKTGLAGSCLASIGLGLSYFATSVPFLIVTIGIVMAMGVMCMYIVSSAAVGQHFPGKQSLVVLAMTNACAGIGGMVFPFILSFLTERYSLRGTLLICAGLVANTIPCALLRTKPQQLNIKDKNVVEINNKDLDVSSEKETETRHRSSYKETHSPAFVHHGNSHIRINYAYEDDRISLPRPINRNEHSPVPNRTRQQTNNSPFPDQTHQDTNNYPLPDRTVQQSRSNYYDNHENIDYIDRTQQDNDSPCAIQSQHKQEGRDTVTIQYHSEAENMPLQDMTFAKSIKHLAKNRSFIFFIFGMAFSYPPFVILITFVVDTFQDSGLSEDNAYIGLFLLNVLSILGRLLLGILVQSKYIKTMMMPITASLVAAACMTGFILIDLLHLKLVFLSLTGICFGIIASCFNVTTLDIVGPNYLGYAMGFAFTLNGIANIIAGPLCGLIRDSTGSYLLVFLISSGAELIALVLFAITHRFQTFTKGSVI